MALEMHCFVAAAEAASTLASRIALDLATALETAPRALLLLSGGQSPVALFHALGRERLDWNRIDISLVDERCAPPGANASNGELVKSELLKAGAARAHWLALIDEHVVESITEDSAWHLAETAAAEANENPLLSQAAVVVLGMGNDGHTASLFVDAPQWLHASTTDLRYVALQPGEAPHFRISLSLQALKQQQRCYVWTVGREKMATLDKLRGIDDDAPISLTNGPMAALMAAPDVLLEIFWSEG